MSDSFERPWSVERKGGAFMWILGDAQVPEYGQPVTSCWPDGATLDGSLQYKLATRLDKVVRILTFHFELHGVPVVLDLDEIPQVKFRARGES